MERKLEDFFSRHLLLQKEGLSEGQLQKLINTIESEYQSWFLSTIIQEIEEIMAIDPSLSVKEIVQVAAERIVQNLAADAATIRMFDPETLRLTSFGAYGVSDYERMSTIPVKNTISGQVIEQQRSIAVPSIMKDPLYQNKDIVRSWGFNSLLAVPLVMPVPKPGGNNLLGSLQIYYKEDDRKFDKLEVIHAELLARRISFVLAKKKILDLEELNRRKETIVNKIFVKLSRREGIKLKDFFVLLIPEIRELLEVQSCSLFTVSEDQQFINLEAAYPQDACYHDAGHSFTIAHHPYFQVAVSETKNAIDTEFERITQAYVLIKDPARSALLSSPLQEFTASKHIHSILLVPLSVDGRVRHLLSFNATNQKHSFSDEEIELLTFFGKEIMKASRLEFFGDILHDIKNPAIAVAGFANRACKLMENADLEQVRGKLKKYLDIMASEAARMQDLAQAMAGEGRETTVELSAIAAVRYSIIEEVVHELKLKGVTVLPSQLEADLFVSCSRFALERVLDNLLSNAMRAAAEQGEGTVALRIRSRNGMAELAIENTGEIPAEHLARMKQGAVKGRGLNIINRFVHTNHGNIKIESGSGITRFIIMLPLVAPTAKH
ncbi:MAG: GAF domain-containing sensor histidine kinase [Deltaproteobacteria bacterium]|nr:GAF domain-containing sensor histidine kinase [Deltaproteobacteria bacterium]